MLIWTYNSWIWTCTFEFRLALLSFRPVTRNSQLQFHHITTIFAWGNNLSRKGHLEKKPYDDKTNLKYTVWKLFINKQILVCKLFLRNQASGLLQIDQKIWKMAMTSQFFHFSIIVNFFYVALFLLSILVTAPSFVSISSLALELWQFFLVRDLPEIWKSEIPPSEFYPISDDWGELWIQNLTRMSLIKCYWILQNARVTAITTPIPN